jgi:FPC/CPF motif-containing protein YcgG
MYKNMEAMMKLLSKLYRFKRFGDSLENLVSLVNLYQNPLDEKVNSYYKMMKTKTKEKMCSKSSPRKWKIKISFSELINKKYQYEKV